MPTISNMIIKDRFDYELMASHERWSLGDAIDLLTSFEMYDKKYYTDEDALYICTRVWDKYYHYISGILYNKCVKCKTYLDDDDIDLQRVIACGGSVINTGTTYFDKDEFIKYIGDNNSININVERLKRCLSGDENMPVPAVSRNVNGPEPSIGALINAADNVEIVPMAETDHQYCFVKTTQSWNLRFGNVSLDGVKDLVGMDYIQVLLKNPGVPIGVYQIQAMLNPIGIKAPEGKNKTEHEEGHAAATSVQNCSYKNNDTISSKSVSLENLKRRLQALSKERNELESDFDHIDLERIDNECAKIEAAIDDIKYAKNDDPEIKNNRDKVAKAIKKAIENISGLKTKEGHPSTPLCNFLTQHIKTASECVYNPPTIYPPDWSF